MLRLAYANLGDGVRDDAKSSGAHLYYAQVLVDVYGFRPLCEKRIRDRKTGGANFSTSNEITTARVAISRAALRLEERGLVTCLRGYFWAGLILTDSGMLLAAELASDKQKETARA